MAKELSKDELHERALRQFARVEEAEADCRDLFIEDMRFAWLDEQWPDWLQKARSIPGEERPCLTINVLRKDLSQVLNDIRQNRPQLKAYPVDSGADVDVAKMLGGLIRSIEYASNVEAVLDSAAEPQVTGGRGVFRIVPAYEDKAKDIQCLRFKRVPNPLTFYGDPDCEEADHSDMRWCFFTTWMRKEDFEHEFPDADPAPFEGASTGDRQHWWRDDDVRIAEYMYLTGPPGEDGTTVMWCKMSGREFLDETEIKCRWIPAFVAAGREFNIENEIFWQGMVRGAKDAQRSYNYMRSQETEAIGLAPIAPFIGTVKQFQDRKEWKTANRVPHGFLAYNPDGQAPPPSRVQGGADTSAISNSAQAALQDIEHTTGMYAAMRGEPSNEKSGKAILAREHEGDVGVFHFMDNLNRAYQHAGRCLLDMIPHYYDGERTVRITQEDGSMDVALFRENPNDEALVVETIGPGPLNPDDTPDGVALDEGETKTFRYYDPSVGRYDVRIATGPSYTTKRRENAEAMIEFVQAIPNAAPLIGDIIAKNLEWDGAEEIGERLKLALPPEIQEAIAGENSEGDVKAELKAAQAQLQQMEQQMQMMQAQSQELMQGLQQAMQELENKTQEYALKKYDIDMKFQKEAIEAQEATRRTIIQTQAKQQEAAAKPYNPGTPQG
jgi:hypothetical protein